MSEAGNGSVKGRGATFNTANRFERVRLEAFPDLGDPEPGPAPRTAFFKDLSRTVLSRNDSPDIPFSASINPYRGCEHGCIYCYARPTHEYLGLSAGLDFESKIFVKERAPELLREKLQSRGWKPQTISVSGVTDPYQPVERRLGLTRRCLEVLTEFRNPFTVISKNHLITRDIDLLAEMARLRAAAAFVTITTLDPDLCALLEPRTSRPAFRLQAVRELSSAGVPVGVMVAPVIPGLTDEELPAILAAAAEAGARFAGFVPLRLPLTVEPLFVDWLGAHYPERKEKVLNRIRSMRGGKLNDPRFGERMRGSGVFADQMRSLFEIHARRAGLNREELELTAEHFALPGQQLALL